MVKNYINGCWTESSAVEWSDIINPATELVLERCPLGTDRDVNDAVSAARNAFPKWRQTPVLDRIQPLFRLKALMESNFDSLVLVNTEEHGKTLVESKGDVRRGIQMLETACAMPSLMLGQVSEDVAAGIDCTSVRQPMGVFAAVTPFNFPAMVPFWFWPFAVASGNTFVLKPSERVPLTQMKIFELIEKAGLPPGVLNMIHGGKEVVNALCTHPDIVGISFVGSTPVAQHVYRLATSHYKRVQALGGAKNFMVVLPDAPIESSAHTCLESIIGCAGQRCLAGSVVVQVGEGRGFQERIVQMASDIRIGDGCDPNSQLGPVISKQSRERICGLIQSAVDEGAELLLDGRLNGMTGRGFFLRPTVLGRVTENMRVAQEEIFGPVVCLANAKTLDEAIQWINRSPFANTASLMTQNGAAARQFSYEARPAMLGLNIGVPAPMAYFSFGGAKNSFFGDVKAHGSQSVLFFTDQKVMISRWNKNSNIW